MIPNYTKEEMKVEYKGGRLISRHVHYSAGRVAIDLFVYKGSGRSFLEYGIFECRTFEEWEDAKAALRDAIHEGLKYPSQLKPVDCEVKENRIFNNLRTEFCFTHHGGQDYADIVVFHNHVTGKTWTTSNSAEVGAQNLPTLLRMLEMADDKLASYWGHKRKSMPQSFDE